MISDKKLKHMIGVARECYSLAKKYGESEENARDYFLMGLLHDVGYEFCEEGEDHAKIGKKMLEHVGFADCGLFRWNQIIKSIGNHGNPERNSLELPGREVILDIADLTINSEGEKVTFNERLEEIKERYGDASIEYAQSQKLVGILKIRMRKSPLSK